MTSKMTKAQRQKVVAVLVKRWKTVLQEDNQTDGFWADVAMALGHDDVSETTAEQALFSAKVIDTACAWLDRMPEGA